MIAVDTSALIAIALGEPKAAMCIAALEADDRLLMSAGTVAEALIVAGRRGIAAKMLAMIEQYGFEILDVTPATAKRVAAGYAKWGKGVHAASLNFSDCFAYEVAASHGCGLLFVGEDFPKTDVRRVL